MNIEKILDVIEAWLLNTEEDYDYTLKELEHYPEDELINLRCRDLKIEIMTYKRVLKLFKRKI